MLIIPCHASPNDKSKLKQYLKVPDPINPTPVIYGCNQIKTGAK